MQQGVIIGHEFMSEVVEVGSQVNHLEVGDRVVVPSTIGCGHCHYCNQDMWFLCDNANPNAFMEEALFGDPTYWIKVALEP